MSSHIHTWIDGYVTLRDHAYQSRGLVEINPNTPDAARWPRTTGADVVTIAAIVDSAVRAHGTPGIRRRWRETSTDLARDALTAPAETYVHDRAFWASFGAVAVFLDDVEAPLPSPAIWDALIAEVSTPATRNAGPREDGPFAHFENIKTYDELWSAQRTYLAGKRGSDMVAPPAGFGGGTQPVPRTTNADVLQLATYWTHELGSVKHEMGHDGIVAMWQVALGDVDKLAKPGTPDAVYAKNNELWASSRRVAIQIAVSDETPTKWEMVVSSIKDGITHLPQAIESVASKGADLVASAAHAVGKVANEAGKGMFAGFGTPLLIGAGLLGVFLISRARHHEEA